jgi:phage shock protein PspC (stress-responsive transcriptional regulator)
MSQTPGPSATDEQQPPPAGGPPPGADRPHFQSLEHLRRSSSDRKIAGVAGGLGRHLNIDPTIVRVVLVVLCFFGGAGFLLYGAAWALVPEDGQRDGNIAVRPSTRNALLIIAGVVATLLLLGDSWGGIGFPWPLFVVGVGVLIYLAARDRGQPAPPQGQFPHQGSAPHPGQYTGQYTGQHPGEYTGEYTGQAGQQQGAAPSAPYGPVGAAETQPGPAYPQATPPWLPPAHTASAYPAPRPKRGPRLFGPTLALVALALGSLGLYDATGGSVLDSAYPALALGVVGAMLVLGAFVGRAGGLVFLGIVAAAVLAVTSLVGALGGIGDGDGERLNATPLSAAAVEDSYYVPNGRVVVDLSEVRDPAQLDGRSIEVGARAGEVLVILPEGVVSDVDAEISGPGQIDLPDHSAGGFDNDISQTIGSGPDTLSIRAHLFAGHIEVRTP